MTQYNTLNIKLSISQLNKFKYGIKNGTEVTLKLSSNVVGDSNDENNFPHKLLLTIKQVPKFRKALGNGNGRLLGPFLKSGLPLMKTVLRLLAKSVLIPLGLTEAASATDAAIHKKMFGSVTTALIISNEEWHDIMKIIKSLEESGLMLKGFSETIKNEGKQKGGFLGMLLGTLGASLLVNLLTGKGTIRAGEDTIRAGQGC